MSNSESGLSYVLEHGAEVQLEDEDRLRKYDRIELTPSGMVVCINKKSYSKDIIPRERIAEMNTHTSDAEENAEWW